MAQDTYCDGMRGSDAGGDQGLFPEGYIGQIEIVTTGNMAEESKARFLKAEDELIQSLIEYYDLILEIPEFVEPCVETMEFLKDIKEGKKRIIIWR